MSTELETPSHYKGTAIIDFCTECNIGFALGNVIKYVLRYEEKNGIEDLKKALFYLDFVHFHHIKPHLQKMRELLTLYDVNEFQEEIFSRLITVDILTDPDPINLVREARVILKQEIERLAQVSNHKYLTIRKLTYFLKKADPNKTIMLENGNGFKEIDTVCTWKERISALTLDDRFPPLKVSEILPYYEKREWDRVIHDGGHDYVDYFPTEDEILEYYDSSWTKETHWATVYLHEIIEKDGVYIITFYNWYRQEKQ